MIISDIEILDSIKESGFRNIFIHWESNEYNEQNWTEQLEYINIYCSDELKHDLRS